MGAQSMQGRERTLSLLALGAVSAVFLAFAAAYAGRAVNDAWGDVELGGWSAALGHRLLSGERLYRELGLTLSPGAPIVLAAIEHVAGGPRWLHEIWVCALSCLALGWLAYGIARPLVGRDNALFVAVGTLAWVCGWARELASDYLARIASYGVVLLLVRAVVEVDERRGRRLYGRTGALAGTALFFDASAGFGALAGLLVVFVYRAATSFRELERLRARARDAVAAFYGALGASAAAVAAVWALGGSPLGFLRAVYVDGPELRGGTAFFIRNALHGLAWTPVAPMSLAHLSVLVGAMVLAATRHGRPAEESLAVGVPDGIGVRGPSRAGTAAGAAAIACVAFGWAGLTLARDGHVPAVLSRVAVVAFGVVPSGVVIAAALCFVSLGKARGPVGQAFGAASLATLTMAVVVSASTFELLGAAHPTIVVALSAVFLAIEMAGLQRARLVVLALLVTIPLTSKLPRCLLARTRADVPFLAGLRMNDGAREMLQAVRRVRELAAEHDTVLVLPEDPSLAMMIGRPRPALCGALVFVDQYPSRCLAADQAYLAEHLPKVVVARPVAPDVLSKAFRVVDDQASPAEVLLVSFVWTHAAAYRLDSVYRTPWVGKPGEADLEVWVRR